MRGLLCALVVLLTMDVPAGGIHWVELQLRRSLLGILQNVSPDGARKGAVVASPSRENPDYFYVWVRDGALVMDTLLRQRQLAEPRSQLRMALLQHAIHYVDFARAVQETSNPSGDVSGSGLGEPKFNADGSAFTGPWGRPQSDGPALRAIALIRLAEQLLGEGQLTYVRNFLYDGKIPAQGVIKADLEYVAHRWRDASVDLWEEVRGDHFYTRMVQRRALIDGARLAQRLGDEGAAKWYDEQANALDAALSAHWDEGKKIIQVTRNFVGGGSVDYKHSGLDIAVVLGALHGESYRRDFGVTDDRVLSTAAQLVVAFDSLYAINKVTKGWDGSALGVALGRYPEDKYNGYHSREAGNPWFLSTSAMAELLFRCAARWKEEGRIVLTDRSLPFWKRVVGVDGLRAEEIGSASPQFEPLLKAVRDAGDRYLARVRQHMTEDGAMTEQFNRDTGFATGAADLTWSYAAFATAAWARRDAER